MISNLPFIHLVKTPISYYIYDVNTNRIITISEQTYDFLESSQKELCFELEKSNITVRKEIENLQEQGFLSSKRPIKMRHPETDFLEYHLMYNCENLLLQLTQNCNFRCSYCSYSQNDFEHQRSHSLRNMTYDTAKSCIDFFAIHSRDCMSLTIGFYGGEPLLEFNLLKEIVLYAEEIFEGKEIEYFVTTNGSIMNKEIAEFFSKYNFHLTISIDGPPEIHNRSRKFAKTGKGTFDKILDNIYFIEENYPLLHSKLNFNAVIDPRFSINKLYKLFNSEDTFKNISVRTSIIDDMFSNEKVVVSNEYLISKEKEDFFALLAFIGKLPDSYISRIALDNIQKFYIAEKDSYLPISNISDETSHSGPCIPGQTKLFVDVNGDFFPCEKVSETSEIMKIGDIKNGFNIDKISSLLNICSLNENKCKNCWIINKCTICARHCDNNNELSKVKKNAECKKALIAKSYDIEKYIMIKEMVDIYGGNKFV